MNNWAILIGLPESQVPLSAQMPSSSFEWPDDLLGPFGQHLNGHDFPQQVSFSMKASCTQD